MSRDDSGNRGGRATQEAGAGNEAWTKKIHFEMVLFDEGEFSAAIWTLRLPRCLDRQINPGVRIPQAHLRQGAMQWQIFPFDFVSTL